MSLFHSLHAIYIIIWFQSNAKMSVDVIQDMKIENDTKCIDNIK